MKILKVKCLAPTRLDNYLTQQFPALTPGRLNKALRENKIKLNGKKQPLSTRVMAGDEIKLFILDEVLDADRGIVKIVEEKQPGAKEVETRYETIAVSGRLALLKVQLITGRTHQIRAHMASIGCPILGDSKYGNNTANRELKLKYQALCAWELTMPRFNQPDFEFLSGKTFRAPKPWYYSQVLDGTLK